ncbi:unnamed protein product [Strongylus vulgaris]|uniref:Uncharacterized protein n=1 Tax=Strongylus vulgaris TaxID=40348 RepID=A0A3P7J4Q7_STRVU|nr:unnamed protein product [Strongylus vulgaris]
MYRLEIGDARANRSLDELKAQPLVLYEWGSTLSLPAYRWAYTVTTMAIYDNNAGQVVSIFQKTATLPYPKNVRSGLAAKQGK